MAELLGGVDLVIISAGAGHINPQHNMRLDRETIGVNISGFMAIAEAAFRHFQRRGTGHLAAITSIAALRGSADSQSMLPAKHFNRCIWTVCASPRSRRSFLSL